MSKADRPLTLFQLGFKLRRIRGEDGRSNVYLDPPGVRVNVHPAAKNVPMDGPFPKTSFFLPGGIVRKDNTHASAMTCLSNQMIGEIPMHQPLFTRKVTSEYSRVPQSRIDKILRRNKRRPNRMLPMQTIRFPR